MGGWRDEPKILTRGDGGMEGIPPRPGTAMIPCEILQGNPDPDAMEYLQTGVLDPRGAPPHFHFHMATTASAMLVQRIL